ncbi:hypothetical protein DERP_012837 [Dermatophagoides pteronyssinus]|uniref:Uncharacterized protein n=1 Tax=Dermatophagoides pteronyssinus TaxID=6956 RepID=A0ABQ8JF66_DERPT|nr:hypothetical protein DERP_012837 [Dermatophagoides pteronyssinus]
MDDGNIFEKPKSPIIKRSFCELIKRLSNFRSRCTIRLRSTKIFPYVPSAKIKYENRSIRFDSIDSLIDN